MDTLIGFLRQEERMIRISKQASWQFLGKIITSVSTFIILGVVTRTYGETNTGVLTLALAYLAFFSLITDFGINPHLMPIFIKDNFSLEWQKLFGLRLVLALSAVILAVLLVLFWPSQQVLFKQIVFLGIISIFESAIFITANIIFQSKLRYDLSVASVALGTLATLGFIFYASKLDLGISGLMFGYIIGWVATSALVLVLAKIYVKSILPVFDFEYILRVLKQSWPISLTLTINLAYFRIDAFLVSYFKTFADVGIYNLSYQVFQSLLVIPAFIMNSFYPMAVNDYLENINKFRSNLIKICIIMFVAAFIGTILTLLLSPLAIYFLTGGKGFAGSIQSLQMLSLGFPAFFVSSVLMWAMVILRKYKQMLKIYIIGFVFNFLMNVILVPGYSYMGASAVTVLSEYLILIMQLIILVPQFKTTSNST